MIIHGKTHQPGEYKGPAAADGERKTEKSTFPPEDGFITSDEVAPTESCPRVFGALTAMAGAMAGRALTLPMAGALLAGAAVAAVGGALSWLRVRLCWVWQEALSPSSSSKSAACSAE